MKVALIIEAAHGAGLETAMKLLGEGYCIAVTDRSHERLTEVYGACNPAKVLMLQIDPSDSSMQELCVNETIKRFGKVDLHIKS
jgi:NADP-dependent 3-hydroxy acid dehydrogenase YdfG